MALSDLYIPSAAHCIISDCELKLSNYMGFSAATTTTTATHALVSIDGSTYPAGTTEVKFSCTGIDNANIQWWSKAFFVIFEPEPCSFQAKNPAPITSYSFTAVPGGSTSITIFNSLTDWVDHLDITINCNDLSYSVENPSMVHNAATLHNTG